MDLLTTGRRHTIVIFLTIITCNHLMEKAWPIGAKAQDLTDYEYEIQKCYKLNMIQYSRESLDHPIQSKSANRKMGIIQSPNYPSKYFKHIDCVFLIHAPPGHIVSIKSYERFDIEPSADCQHDYLEIRDGLFGYSPLIGKYCNGYPMDLPIESSNTELWIRFKTDDSIEQHGFRIVYEFKMVTIFYKPHNHKLPSDQETLKCEIHHKYTNVERLTSMTIDNEKLEEYYYSKLNELIATQKNVSQRYNIEYLKKNLDCTIHVEVHRGEQISIAFENVTVSMHKNLTRAEHSIIPVSPLDSLVQDCDTNFLEIYDASTSENNKKIHFCSTRINKFFKSKANRIFIRYSIKKDDLRVMTHFTLTYNPFHRSATGLCSNDTFRCDDGSCIDPLLVCDGKRNCNSSNDESLCTNFFREQIKVLSDQPFWLDQTKLAYIHKISIMTIGGLLTILIITSLVVSCNRSIKMHLRNVKDFETNHKNKSSTDTNEQSERLFENREIINTKKWVV